MHTNSHMRTALRALTRYLQGAGLCNDEVAPNQVGTDRGGEISKCERQSRRDELRGTVPLILLLLRMRHSSLHEAGLEFALALLQGGPRDVQVPACACMPAWAWAWACGRVGVGVWACVGVWAWAWA